MNCALASRMHLLLHLKKWEGLTPKKWLLVQIMITKETDYLHYLTKIFRKANESYLVKLWAECRKEFKCSERKMPVYIDEAQVLLPQIEDFFPGTNKRRPLYTAVVNSILLKGNVQWNNCIFTLIVSGTALSLESAAESSTSSYGSFRLYLLSR